MAVVAGKLALELVLAQATTPMVRVPTLATTATALTDQITRQQALWALATRLAQDQAQAQATTGTTPPLAQAVAMAVATLAPAVVTLEQVVATAVARLAQAVALGTAVAILGQGMTETTLPPVVVAA